MMKITTPIKWHGGKHYLQKFLHAHAPAEYTHRNYGCAGMLSEFWNWEHEGISETVNDVNGEITNFFRVLQQPKKFKELQRRLACTPFSDQEFAASRRRIFLEETDVNHAASFFAAYRMSRQGLGKGYATPTTRTRRGMNENVSAYLSAIEGLEDCHQRLIRVEIVNKPVIEFIMERDHDKAFFYLDPPYLQETRNVRDAYAFEMTFQQHKELLECLSTLKGMFMLSGYPSALYAGYADQYGWRAADYAVDNKASSKRQKPKMTERIWMNYAA